MSLVHDQIHQSTSFYRGDEEEVESIADSDATCLPSDSPHLDSQQLSLDEPCSQNTSAGKISQRNTPTQSYHLANQRDLLTRHSTTLEEKEIEPFRELEMLNRMKKELCEIRRKLNSGRKIDGENLLLKVNEIEDEAEEQLILLSVLQVTNSQTNLNPHATRFAARKTKFKLIHQTAISLKNRIKSKLTKPKPKSKHRQTQNSQQQQNSPQSPSLLQRPSSPLKQPSTNQFNTRTATNRNHHEPQHDGSIFSLLYPEHVRNNLPRLSQMQQTRVRFISKRENIPTFAVNLCGSNFAATLSSSAELNKINQW